MQEVMEFKRTPVPVLYTYKGHVEQGLFSNDANTVINIKTSENINEVKKMTFTAPLLKDRKLNYGDNEKRIYFDGVVYIIRDMQFEDSDSSKNINVTCEEYCTVLKNVKCENICQIARSPKQIWDSIVTASKLNVGYTWLGTDITDGILRHLITTSETSFYENLIQLAEVFNGSIEFSYNEQGDGFVFLKTKPTKTGKYYKDGIDLKTLNITYNSNELCSKIFATGVTDDNGIVLDIQAVNGGNSLLVDKSYFIALGIPNDLLETDPQYNGIYEFNDTNYTDASDLLIKAQEELAKVCVPKITAEITVSDLSMIVNSPIEKPMIGEEIKIINKEIGYIFDTFITGIERDYTNPLNTQLTISNDIPYKTYVQTTNKTSDIVSDITTSNPLDTDGNVIGDGSSTVIMSKVVDGDHINCVYRIGQSFSEITEQGNLISLRVNEQNVSFAELKLTADSITSTVSDISDVNKQVYSQVTQTAKIIKSVVVEGADGSSIELSKSAFKVAFLKSSADITTIDEFGITASNSSGGFSRLGSNGLEHLDASMTNGIPYHYWSQIGTHTFTDAESISDWDVTLDSQFKGARVRGIAGIQKISSEGECCVYWMASYISNINMDNMKATVSGQAVYRDLVDTQHPKTGGTIVVSYLFIG